MFGRQLQLVARRACRAANKTATKLLVSQRVNINAGVKRSVNVNADVERSVNIFKFTVEILKDCFLETID
jgi:hypothetical protein